MANTTIPAPPATPAPDGSGSPPEVQISFPVPGSFAAHRRHRSSLTASGLDGPLNVVSEESSSPGLSKGEMETPSVTSSTRVYRIPQRTPTFRLIRDGSKAPPSTPTRGPPRPLQLGGGGTRAVSNPQAPATAPVSRLSGAAAARGLSIDTRKVTGRSRIPGTASLVPLRQSGITENAPSPGFGGRTRGLTVALLVGEAGMIAESAPVTPGLGAAPRTTATEIAPSPALPSATQRKEIILCRYYHTPGLSCTSSPCRFVHNLDSLRSNGPRTGRLSTAVPSPLPVVSPALTGRRMSTVSVTSPDPTRGTFALAQAAQPIESACLDEMPVGELVTVRDEDTGEETQGQVFKMSGGGKGPAGKSRCKYKTIPCKDFAENNCPYGVYCSFIHDQENLYDPAKHAKQVRPAPQRPTPSKRSPLEWRSSTTPTPKHKTHRPQPLSNLSTPTTYNTSPDLELVQTPQDVRGKDFRDGSTPLDSGQSRLHTPLAVPGRTHPKMQPPPRAVEQGGIWQAVNMTQQAPNFLPMNTPEYSPTQRWTPSDWVPQDWNGNGWAPADQWGAVVPQPWVSIPHPTPVYSPTSESFWPVPPSSPMSRSMGPNSGSGVMWTAHGWSVADTPAMKSPGSMPFDRRRRTSETRGSAPSMNKMYYKTRACRYFAEGHCPHGAACTYRHVMTKKATEPLPRHARRPSKCTPCKYFNTASGCERGDKECQFLHEPVVPENEGLVIPSPRPYRTRPCRHFQTGQCGLGTKCNFAHVLVDAKTLEASKHLRAGSQASYTSAASEKASSPVELLGRGHHPLPRCASAPADVPPSRDTPIAVKPPCAVWARTGRCSDAACEHAHIGEGGEANAALLTEERLAAACEELRLLSSASVTAPDSDEDDDDDDLEIVTNSTRTSSSRAYSSGAASV